MASKCFSEDLTCSICLCVFTEPVMLQCGHSFCRKCITASLDKQKQCPVCRSTVEGQSLPTNHVLKSLVEKATQKLQYRHDKETADFLCPEHEEKLKLYCVTEQQLICVICGYSQKHQSHQVKPVNEGSAIMRGKLEHLVRQITEDTEALESLVQSQKEEEVHTKQRSEELTTLISTKFKEMNTFLEQRERELTDKVKSDEKCSLNKMTEILKNLEAAIAENREVEAIATSALQIQDHEHFLKKWSEEKTLRNATRIFKPKGGNFMVEKSELSLEPYESHLQLFVWKEMLQVVKPREEPLLLKKDKTNLLVSEDQHSATICQYKEGMQNASYYYEKLYNSYARMRQNFQISGIVCDIPKSIPIATSTPTPTQSTTKLGEKHYWEVYVGQHKDWQVGLPQAYLNYKDGKYRFTSNGIKSLAVQDNLKKIGVYLNCSRKELSFYNAENMKHIHTERLPNLKIPQRAHFWFGKSTNNCHDPLMVCQY